MIMISGLIKNQTGILYLNALYRKHVKSSAQFVFTVIHNFLFFCVWVYEERHLTCNLQFLIVFVDSSLLPINILKTKKIYQKISPKSLAVFDSLIHSTK